MSIHQITIIGTGLIGGSFALALKQHGFGGRIVGCDRVPVLEKARELGAIDEANADPVASVQGSALIVLATPVGAIIDLIQRLGPHLPDGTLLTDTGSTKAQVVEQAQRVFGARASSQFLAGHPMAGREQSGIEFADPNLFHDATWFVTPLPAQEISSGLAGEFLEWVGKIGARVVPMDAQEHDRLCAWISHLPQMLSTALAASLVEEFEDAPLDAGGRALREMTRISSSPYSMWRDIAITNKENLAEALLKIEQHLAHIRENLGSRELAAEFEQAHELKLDAPSSRPPRKS